MTNRVLLEPLNFPSCPLLLFNPLICYNGEVKEVDYSVVIDIGIKTLLHKTPYIVDSLYNKRIDLTLFFTGYYPVVFVRLTRLGAAVGLC